MTDLTNLDNVHFSAKEIEFGTVLQLKYSTQLKQHYGADIEFTNNILFVKKRDVPNLIEALNKFNDERE